MIMDTYSKRRIGLTMRVVNAEGYWEPRDALAQNWYSLMNTVMPEAAWVPIPNIRGRVADFVEQWRLDGVILTGGNDLGDAPVRDETENGLLDVARQRRLPVLGVCRGLQVICRYFNIPVILCPAGGHAGTKHHVRFIGQPMGWQGEALLVNSYHNQCVGSLDESSGCLKPFAVSSDGLVEGVLHSNEKICGVMWHPERQNPISAFDAHLIRSLFIT